MNQYIGKRLDGRYEIKEIIGAGGMAYVYKAHDCIDDREVAVKILREEFLENEEFVRRFRNESKAIAILSHPNIVKVLDVNFSDTLQYIVMEYIDGITLKEYLDQQREVKWKEAVHFTTQILRALQHAHDKGIVHRDIKPQNIMLLPDGTIKVTDFGIARFSRQDIRVTATENKAIGSVHYISPEQARGEVTDEKADIYSVGVMLYEMLTGTVPFDADNAVSVAIMQLQSEPKMIHEINPQIPEGLEEITMKALQKDAGDRYQSAAEMLKDIDAFKRDPGVRFEYKYFVDKQPTRFVDTISEVRGEQPGEEPEEEEEKEKKSSLIPILAGVAGAFMLVAIIFVAWLGLSKVFGNNGGEKIVMDNFVGKNYTNVVNNPDNLRKYNFLPQQTEYNSDYPEGTIIKQEPASGREVFTGSDVTLYVSLGENLIDVPEVLPGEDKEMVRQKLINAGFETKFVYEPSDEVAEGMVIRTDPAYPNARNYGAVVDIYLSSGKKPVEPVEVPSVTSEDKSQAEAQLRSKGFESHVKIINYSDTRYIAGTVISQEPGAGTLLTPGSTVTLTVASGYQDASVNVTLPNTSTAVDLQVYIDGRLSKEPQYSSQLRGLLPNQIHSQKLTFTEQQSNYTVTVKIKASGQKNFTDYVTFRIDGKTGTAAQTGPYAPFQEPTTTTSTRATTTTTTTRTTTTTSTTQPPQPTEPSVEPDVPVVE